MEFLKNYIDHTIFFVLGFMSFLVLWFSVERVIFYARLEISDYKTKEDWFAKVNEVWEKTYNILEKGEGETEIIAPLPGVNTDLCVDEKISLNAMVYSVCVMIAIVAVFYAICTM